MKSCPAAVREARPSVENDELMTHAPSTPPEPSTVSARAGSGPMDCTRPPVAGSTSSMNTGAPRLAADDSASRPLPTRTSTTDDAENGAPASCGLPHSGVGDGVPVADTDGVAVAGGVPEAVVDGLTPPDGDAVSDADGVPLPVGYGVAYGTTGAHATERNSVWAHDCATATVAPVDGVNRRMKLPVVNPVATGCDV
jgi:hypothetical protein